MERYKEVLRKRIILLSVLAIFAAILEFCSIFNIFGIEQKETFTGVEVVAFQAGILTGIIIMAMIIITRFIVATRDDTKLKKLYNYENDERRKVIKEKSGANVMIPCASIIIFTGIIMGYFNELVFLSLIGCGIFLLIVSAVLKLYYSKKY